MHFRTSLLNININHTQFAAFSLRVKIIFSKDKCIFALHDQCCQEIGIGRKILMLNLSAVSSLLCNIENTLNPDKMFV